MSKAKLLITLVAVGISAIFLWLVFKDINGRELWAAITSINLWWFLLFNVITWISYYWRAIRWKVLLGPECKLSAWKLFGPLMVGFGFNSVFPGRVGEVARPIALMKKEGVPFGTGLSTVFIERVFDALTLLGFFVLLPHVIQFDPALSWEWEGHVLNANTLREAAIGASYFVAVLFVGSVLMIFNGFRQFVLRIILAMPLIPAGIKEKIKGLFESFAAGFDSLKSPWLLIQVIVHSLIVWALNAGSIWMLSWGMQGVELSMLTAFAYITVICVAILIPAAPGYWGLFEAGGALALILCGAVANTDSGKTLAVSFTLIIHFIQWVQPTIIGLYYAGKIGIKASDAAVPTGPAK